MLRLLFMCLLLSGCGDFDLFIKPVEVTGGKKSSNQVPSSSKKDIPPQLSEISSQIIHEQVDSFSYDFNDINSQNDKDGDGDAISYLCFYDKLIDGDVEEMNSCDELGMTIGDRSGTVYWRPSYNQADYYEIKIIGKNKKGRDEKIFDLLVKNTDRPPVIENKNIGTFFEDEEKIIVLGYLDEDGEDATTCSINGLVNIVESTACSCNSGVCSVGIKGKSNYFGTQSITYGVGNNLPSNEKEITFEILPVNDSPQISAILDTTTNEDTVTSALPITISDVDSTLNCHTSLSMVSSNQSLIENNHVVFSGVAPNCSAVVTPKANQYGSTSLSFTVSDGSLTASKSFLLTVKGVNDAPTISSISNQTIDEDTSTPTLSFNINDLETSLDCASSVSMISSNQALLGNSNVVFSGTAPDCTVTLSPKADHYGSTNINLSVTDGDLTAISQFILTVNSINDAPVLATINNLSTNEDEATSSISFTINDVDSSLTCASSVATFSSNSELIDSNGIVLSGTAPNCIFVLTPKSNQFGVAEIEFKLSDGHRSVSRFFEFTVLSINDAPTMGSVTDQSIMQDTSTNAITLSVADIDSTLNCSSGLSLSSSNEGLIDSSGVVFSGTAPNCQAVLTPKSSQYGTSNISFSISDGSLSASQSLLLTVTQQNPANLDSLTDINVNEGEAIATIDANDGGDDYDVDGDSITYSCGYDLVVDGAVSLSTSCSSLIGLNFNSSTGVLNWTPSQKAYTQGDHLGRYEFVITGTSIGGSSQQIFVISVNQIDVEPNIMFGDQLTFYLGIESSIDLNDQTNENDFDADGDVITYTCSWDSIDNNIQDAAFPCSVNGVSFNLATGEVTATPTVLGTFEFKIVASEGDLNQEIFMTIQVLPKPAMFKKVASGEDYSCGMTASNDLYCWGAEGSGQLGYTVSADNNKTPFLVDTSSMGVNENLVDFFIGKNHTCGLTSESNLVCWGSGLTGQLGAGSTSSSQNPTFVDDSQLAVNETFEKVALGGAHSCAISNLNKTYCWGSDSHGQLGVTGSSANLLIPTMIDSTNLQVGEVFTDLSLGVSHSCGLTNLHQVYCWGDDSSGALGDGGSILDRDLPFPVDTSTMLAGERFLQVVAGDEVTCGLSDLNQLYCWGSDDGGALGNGTESTTDIQSPIIVNNSNFSFTGEVILSLHGKAKTFCVISNRGQSYCWGEGTNQQIGNSFATNEESPVYISHQNLVQGEVFMQIAPGYNHTCGMSSHGQTYCWGNDASGALGDDALDSSRAYANSIKTSEITATEKIVHLEKPGNSHNCARTSLGRYFCWGSGTSGQLGQGLFEHSHIPVELDLSDLNSGVRMRTVSPGGSHSCGISTEGEAYCWGDDGDGELGNGSSSSESKAKPTLVSLSGMNPGERFIEITAGRDHSCGISTERRVFCWGSDEGGQLGNNNLFIGQTEPVLVNTSIINSGERAIGLQLNWEKSYVITNQKRVLAWGGNNYWGLGHQAGGPDRPTPVHLNFSDIPSDEEIISHSIASINGCVMTDTASTYCWGNNFYGTLGNASGKQYASGVPIARTWLNSNETFLKVEGGYSHFCGITNLKQTLCWGYNSHGQLGLGHFTNSSLPVVINYTNFDQGEYNQEIISGLNWVCALSTKGEVRCWGNGGAVQGNGGLNSTHVLIPDYKIDESNFLQF